MSTPTPDQHAIDALVARLRGAKPTVERAHLNGHGGVTELEDEEIITLCRKAKNAAKFSSLFDDGDTSAHGGDDSRADLSLIGIMAFYTQDPDQLDRLVRRSALYRPKWDERRGPRTYGQRTIDRALRDVAETYQGGKFDSSDPKKDNSDESNSSDKPLPFKTGREIAEATPVKTEWVAYPWFAKGTITELSGPIKRAGKTTLMAHAVAKILDGAPFMGSPTTKTGVIYLTEQSPNSFRRVIRDAGLEREDFHVLYWHECRGIEWPDLIATVIEEAKRIGAGLLVIDVLSRWCDAGGADENSPEYANKAMPPLKEAVSQGLTVAYLRHDRKGGGEVGESGRGTSQIGGDADQLLQLTRPAGGNARPTVRVLSAVGRFGDDTPEQITIELDQERGEYRSLGDSAAYAKQQAMTVVADVVPTGAQNAWISDEVVNKAIEQGCTRSEAYKALRTLADAGTITRVGKGRKGDPHRYFKPSSEDEQFVSSDSLFLDSDETNSPETDDDEGSADDYDRRVKATMQRLADRRTGDEGGQAKTEWVSADDDEGV